MGGHRKLFCRKAMLPVEKTHSQSGNSWLRPPSGPRVWSTLTLTVRLSDLCTLTLTPPQVTEADTAALLKWKHTAF